MARTVFVTDTNLLVYAHRQATLDHGATEVWSQDRGLVTLPGLALVDPHCLRVAASIGR